MFAVLHIPEAPSQAAHDALVDCACAFSPRVEADPATPEIVILDLEGLERLFGPPASIARELAARAASMGLEIHVAVAGNIDTAILAARGFAGITVIPPGEEAARLGTLPVSSFEFQVSGFKSGGANSKSETRNLKLLFDTLARWGIHTLRGLAALPQTAVRQRLGEAGVHLQRLARGEVSRPLVPTPPPLHFEITTELEHPLTLLEPLAFLLSGMLEQLCARLEARALATQELRLNLGTGHNYALRLPVPMVNAKTFLKLLQLELSARPPGQPVEKIHLAADPILPRPTQGGLFLPATPEPEKLEVVLARIRKTVSRFTFHVPRQQSAATDHRVGTAELLDTHRPDAFRINSGFLSASPPNPNRAEIVKRETVLRRYRPPRPVRVKVRDGVPVSVCDFYTKGAETTAAVLWAAGPWRAAGEWWTETPWEHEVWDLALSANQLVIVVRAFRDLRNGQWFMEAVYD